MKKYFLAFALLTALTLVVSGCAVKDAQDASAVNSTDKNNRRGDFASGTMKMNFGEPATKADLAAGKKVSVFGKTNTDGTVIATRIVIGDMPMFGRGFATGTPFSATGTRPISRDGEELYPTTSGGKPIGDMTSDQTGGRENFQGRTGRMIRGGGGQSRISGEIMKIDESSIVIKVIDNGSKIIFYTDSTEIFLAPTSTPNFASTTVK